MDHNISLTLTLELTLQFVLWVVIPVMKQPGAASTAKNWLRFVVILQYIPRIIRMVPIQTSLRRPGTLAFETASSGFVINLLIFLLASHVSCLLPG